MARRSPGQTGIRPKAYENDRSRARRYDDRAAESARKLLVEFQGRHSSGTEAAKILGIDQSQFSRILTGTQQAQLPLLLELRKQLGLTLDQILGLDPLPPGYVPPLPPREYIALAERVERLEKTRNSPPRK